MKINDPRHPWWRLLAAARQTPQAEPAPVPYGFSTRVAARAMSNERRFGSLFDRFALRALGVACLLAAASIAINYSIMSEPAHNSLAEEELQLAPVEDPVSVLLDA